LNSFNVLFQNLWRCKIFDLYLVEIHVVPWGAQCLEDLNIL
jgi:hypothetical protein